MPRLGRLGRRIVGCRRCPRLVAYLDECRGEHPDYWARPVPSLGDSRAWLAIVGLAPGYHGANRSGRPFWLDASGRWLYDELQRRGWWDGEQLEGVRILNAVKCVPPQNRPTGEEQDRCRPWLVEELSELSELQVVLALGAIAHRAVLKAWEVSPLSSTPFEHGRVWKITSRPTLLDSYHPSRQNTNTGRLTRRMWQAIFRRAASFRS